MPAKNDNVDQIYGALDLWIMIVYVHLGGQSFVHSFRGHAHAIWVIRLPLNTIKRDPKQGMNWQQ